MSMRVAASQNSAQPNIRQLVFRLEFQVSIDAKETQPNVYRTNDGKYHAD